MILLAGIFKALGQGIGNAFGPTIAGYLIEGRCYSGMFQLIALAQLAGLAVFVSYHVRNSSQNQGRETK